MIRVDACCAAATAAAAGPSWGPSVNLYTQ